jgi:hypothetical protein
MSSGPEKEEEEEEEEEEVDPWGRCVLSVYFQGHRAESRSRSLVNEIQIFNLPRPTRSLLLL